MKPKIERASAYQGFAIKTLTREDVQAQWPGFTVTCNRCQDSMVLLNNDVLDCGTYQTGEIEIQCTNCNKTAVLYKIEG